MRFMSTRLNSYSAAGCNKSQNENTPPPREFFCSYIIFARDNKRDRGRACPCWVPPRHPTPKRPLCPGGASQCAGAVGFRYKQVRRGEILEPRTPLGEVPTTSEPMAAPRGCVHEPIRSPRNGGLATQRARQIGCWERSAGVARGVLAAKVSPRGESLQARRRA